MATVVVGRKREWRADELSGVQRAAIFLMMLGNEDSLKITALMTPEELEQISLEIARLDQVPIHIAESVLQEWIETERAALSLAQGGVEVARQILEDALGPARAATVLRRIENELRESAGFRNLQQADPQQLASVLRNEYPQTIALIMAHLPPPLVADLLKHLDPELGSNALYRMAQMEKVHPDVLQVVDRSLSHDTALSLSKEMTAAGGPSSVAAVLNLVPGTLEKELLSGIESKDGGLCEEVKGLMFVFEDIQRLDDRSLQRLLREVTPKSLALALKVASETLMEKVRSIMSQRAQAALIDEMEFMGPVGLRDVEAAQGTIVKKARELEEAGEITIRGGGDELIV